MLYSHYTATDFLEAAFLTPFYLPHRIMTVIRDVGNYHESVNEWG
jgi:hypothetical protein